MSDNSNESEDSRLDRLLSVELSERELLCIGHIIAQWGALEHEIFIQTLQTFDVDAETLPKEMNNMQFSGVRKMERARSRSV